MSSNTGDEAMSEPLDNIFKELSSRLQAKVREERNNLPTN
jgi:hypothetical protein